MWSDNESAIDMLNVQHIVTAVVDTVTAPKLSPVTVGVYGDWGSGKSTVLTMVRDRLQATDGVLCVYFNGWLFEGYEDAKAALMGTILEELRDQRSALTKATAAFGRLAKRIDWLRFGKGAFSLSVAAATGGVAGLAGLGALLLARGADADADELKKLIKDKTEQEHELHRTVRDFTADFEKVLEQTETKRLVVLIDDLDRCTPERVIETLEAIRLFLSVKGAAFIVAADETLVRMAVANRFPEREAPKLDIGRHYLEKMVQVPIHVPPLGHREIVSYLNLLFAQRHVDAPLLKTLCERVCTVGASVDEVIFRAATAEQVLGQVPSDELKEDLALAAQIGDLLAASVDGNPRQVKRFLNALLLRLQMARSRGISPFERKIAAKLLLLEYFRSETLFRSLNRWQAAQDGTPTELGQLEAAVVGLGGEAHATEVEPQPSAASSAKPLGSKRTAAAPVRDAVAPGALSEQLVSPDAETWLADLWASRWLATQPMLAGIDLRPYFFFAPERLSAGAGPELNLKPAERAAFAQLLSPSEATRTAALGRVSQFSPGEAQAVLAALVHRAEQSEEDEGDASPLTMSFKVVQSKPELAAQLVSFLRTLPAARLRPGIAMRLVGAVRGTQAERAGIALLSDWHLQQQNGRLATAAEGALQRMSEAARPRRVPDRP